MFFSSVRWAVAREFRRPLYRRIFTNKRLDIAHKGAHRLPNLIVLKFLVIRFDTCAFNDILSD